MLDSVVIESGHAVVLTHVRPDGDAIGSATAMAALLRQRGMTAEVRIGQDAPIPAELATINTEVICQALEQVPDCDLLVVTDCGDVSRTGSFAASISARVAAGLPTFVVDHHRSNPGFGTVNVVKPEIESTCSIIWEWVTDYTPEIANALYAGLVTDTGNFRYGRVQAREIAADLVRHGAEADRLVFELIDAVSTADLRIIGKVMAGLQPVTWGATKVVVADAPFELLQHASTGVGERIVDFLRGIDDAELVVVLKEDEPGVIHGSLRSRTLDCSVIAQALGGGGHRGAAGFTAHATPGAVCAMLEEVVAAHAD